jgi:TRAP-type C4-dicarboxylate transport system permease large subunit
MPAIACAIGETKMVRALRDVGIILIPMDALLLLLILLPRLFLALARLLMPRFVD